MDEEGVRRLTEVVDWTSRGFLRSDHNFEISTALGSYARLLPVVGLRQGRSLGREEQRRSLDACTQCPSDVAIPGEDRMPASVTKDFGRALDYAWNTLGISSEGKSVEGRQRRAFQSACHLARPITDGGATACGFLLRTIRSTWGDVSSNMAASWSQPALKFSMFWFISSRIGTAL